MKYITIAKILILLMVISPNVWASCVNESFHEERTLMTLPVQVRQLLNIDSSGYAGIVEINHAFNSSDVVKSGLSMRRLALVAMSPNCVLTAVEHGGRGYSVDLAAFELHDDSWQRIASQIVGKIPKSADELFTLLIKP